MWLVRSFSKAKNSMSTSLRMSSYLARDTEKELERGLRLGEGEGVGRYGSIMNGDMLLRSVVAWLVWLIWLERMVAV